MWAPECEVNKQVPTSWDVEVCRLDQTDGEVQTSGGEATQPGSGEPCSSGGITVPPVSADSNSSAPKDEAVLLKPDSNLGNLQTFYWLCSSWIDDCRFIGVILKRDFCTGK